MIPYGRQWIDKKDIDAVEAVLKSDWLTQGPTVGTFEKEVAAYCGAQYAVAVNSATSALHIACLAAGLGEGDYLWTSPNTFVASANCALYCNAQVDFVDIDPQTYNMDPDKLEEKLKNAKKRGCLPKIIVPVHFSGQSCNMQAIGQMAKHYGITVIEDASHAIGGRYKEQSIGNCAYSDMAVFSFHPVKIITTGEGGMVTTNSEELQEKLFLARSHGITRNPSLMEGDIHGPWYYEQISLGLNYRMTELQAALGLRQMQDIDHFISRRHALVQRYNEAFKKLPIQLPWQHPDNYSAYHLYVIGVAPEKRRNIVEYLHAKEIMVNVHYIPVHTQPYYKRLGFQQGDFPVAERYYAGAISLPLFFGLQEVQQDEVIVAIQEVLNQ